jgi:S-adenosylmethionine:tRNA ribosyltransferase-isomerase
MAVGGQTLEFDLPDSLESGAPPENNGGRRDNVCLMVGYRSSGEILDDRFPSLLRYLAPGDALVINTSATIAAALPAQRPDGTPVLVHLSHPRAEGEWAVEVREAVGSGSLPSTEAGPSDLKLPGGARLRLLRPHPATPRIWLAHLDLPAELDAYLGEYGRPIRYGYAQAEWPLSAYQNVYALQPGSVEMPSAGRPLTAELITSLVAQGVTVLPVVLHAGVASLEEGEGPLEERYQVPEPTAVAANALRAAGGRLLAVGTTVVRALETVSDRKGQLHPGQGLTDLVISPAHPPRSVDGLLTGWHQPRASHLALVEAIAGRELIQTMYRRAVEQGYRWHEFGDSCLILP